MQKTLQSGSGSLPRQLSRPSPINQKSLWVIIFLGLVIWALLQAGLFREEIINPGGWPLAFEFIEASLKPNFTPQFLGLALNATITTLAFAVCGSSLSLLIGFAGGLLASEVWWESLFGARRARRRLRFPVYRLPWLGVRGLLALLRGIHEIIWGLFFINIIGLDPLTAILAIAIPFGAITAKVFSEILDEMPRQAFTALQNSGVSPLKAMAYTLFPQAFLDCLSYGFYRFDCAIRAAIVLGMIGAGGLGFEIFVSLDTLKYEQAWTFFYALFLLNGLTDFWSGLVRRRLSSRVSCTDLCYEPSLGQARRQAISQQDWVVRGSIILVLFLIPFSFWYVEPTWGKLFSLRAIDHLDYIAETAFPPHFAASPLGEWVELSSVTLAMSILGAALAGLFGLAISFPAASNFLLPGGLFDLGGSSHLRGAGGVIILLFARGIMLVGRSIPPPIWALLFLFVVFPGILPGGLALGVYTVGVLGRLMAEVTENLDDRPLSALKTYGVGAGQLFIYGVLPPTVPRFIAYLLYRWEEIIRATVVIGLVGAGGLGQLLVEQLSSFDYHGVLATLIIFVGLTFLVDMISHVARRAFRQG